MRKILRTTLIATILFSPIVQAEWYIVTDDDLFSDGQMAMIIGQQTSNFDETVDHMVIFDCTPRTLTLSLAEKDIEKKESPEPIYPAPMELAIKIDNNSIIRFSATYLRRNSTLTEAITGRTDTEMRKIKTLLKQLREAKYRVKIGARAPNATSEDAMFSLYFNTIGSTGAVNKFITACGIKL